ncbi:MAG: isoprenoid biosynthesis glyoxalase ElbB [Melioribacteraceae bacterium]|nr:isoprenoid biosynthesis glyoxalase ElbB [Melioribacteraceae bacterium]MCF8264561.1 isoprenoid biosynthesis glyoxalase ElbB [Melioribacteraceae bacterium]
MKIGVILSGCGVYDGTEIQEAVFTLLAIDENGADSVCFAPDIEQHHVVNHLNGEEMKETRNVLVEAARIARGDIKSLNECNVDDLDGLVIPGGFGAAKNLTKWAFNGPDGEIDPQVKRVINEFVLAGKPVAGLCMGPTVIAKALDESKIKTTLTVGTTTEKSPYDIKAVSEGMEKAGATAVMKSVREVSIDLENKIVSAPCYMMEASISEIRKNIKDAVDSLIKLI